MYGQYTVFEVDLCRAKLPFTRWWLTTHSLDYFLVIFLALQLTYSTKLGDSVQYPFLRSQNPRVLFKRFYFTTHVHTFVSMALHQRRSLDSGGIQQDRDRRPN